MKTYEERVKFVADHIEFCIENGFSLWETQDYVEAVAKQFNVPAQKVYTDAFQRVCGSDEVIDAIIDEKELDILKDGIFSIITSWEKLKAQNYTSATASIKDFNRGYLNGKIEMLANITGMEVEKLKDRVIKEAHNVGRLMEIER